MNVNPNIDKPIFIQIAEQLEDSIFTPSPSDKQAQPLFANSPIPQLSADEQELLKIYQSLSPAHRSQILEYARYFAEKSGAATRRKA